jgi:hypothetical protein
MQQQFRVAVVLLAPVVILVSFVWAPYVSNFTDNEAVAAKIAANTSRWEWAMLLQAIGLSMTPLAVFALRHYLRDAGEDRWSFVAAGLLTIGSVMLAFGVGTDQTIAVAIDGGASGEAVLDARDAWLLPTLTVSLVVFSLGWLSLALAVRASGVLASQTNRIVTAALIVVAISVFIPVTGGQYLAALGAIVALWPLGLQMRKETSPVSAP